MKFKTICLMSLILGFMSACGNSNSNDNGESIPSDYEPKTIKASGKSYKAFCEEAKRVFDEYRNEINTHVSNERWSMVQRELIDYWTLIDNITPSQTGTIWENERFQNSYDNFAAKIIIEEARILIEKEDDSADDILLELILTVQPLQWSTRDDGPWSDSNKESVLEKVTPTIINLAKLKKRPKIIEFMNEISGNSSY